MENIVKIVSLTVIALAVAAVSQEAKAVDGTINFAGELIDQTCTIQVDGAALPGNVTLPTRPISELATAGQVAGLQDFEISLTGCTGPAVSATTVFLAGATVNPATGNLLNTAAVDPATEVELQLLDGVNDAVIPTGDVSAQRANNSRQPITAGAATMPYSVQYYATGQTTAGSVESSVTFEIDYL